MLFSHNISTPLPQPKSLINNAEPPGQAIGGGTFCAQVQKVARRFAQAGGRASLTSTMIGPNPIERPTTSKSWSLPVVATPHLAPTDMGPHGLKRRAAAGRSPWVKRRLVIRRHPVATDRRSIILEASRKADQLMTPTQARIVVRGKLTKRLATAFDGMTLVGRPGRTELVGEVADQAQLHGLLARIRDLGSSSSRYACRPRKPPAT